MSRFRFSLERVLSWRETKLSLEEADLARLRGEKSAIELAMADLAARNDREGAVLRARQSFSGGDVSEFARTKEWISQEEKRLRARITDCDRALEIRTAAVTEARRAVRLLEKLRDHRQACWRAETNRQSDELAGESAIAGWRRNSSRAADSELNAG